jgi:hypothetical protein
MTNQEVITSMTLAIGLASLHHSDITIAMTLLVETIAEEGRVHGGRKARSVLAARRKLRFKLLSIAENIRMLASNLETLAEEFRDGEDQERVCNGDN